MGFPASLYHSTIAINESISNSIRRITKDLALTGGTIV
jgi:hypothetical protein